MGHLWINLGVSYEYYIDHKYHFTLQTPHFGLEVLGTGSWKNWVKTWTHIHDLNVIFDGNTIISTGLSSMVHYDFESSSKRVDLLSTWLCNSSVLQIFMSFSRKTGLHSVHGCSSSLLDDFSRFSFLIIIIAIC